MRNFLAILIVFAVLSFEFFISVDLGFNIDSRFDPVKNIESFRYIVLPVLKFFLLLALFELIVALVCWLAVDSRKSDASRVALFTCYYLLVKFSLIVYSSLEFPYSRVGRLIDPAVGLAYVLFALAGFIVFMGAVSGIRKAISLYPRVFTIGGLALVSFPLLMISFGDVSAESTKRPKQKNVILLGVDSVSPRHFNNEHDFSEVMPVLHRYFTSGMVYKNAYTPLARTYPAWTSILTGLNPRDSKVIFNLVEANSDVRSLSLPAVLDGYHSVYAMDERRFSMVDESWGFDEVVGPDAGAADFFIDKIRTLSAVNFIHSIPAASNLLPFVNNNRAYDDIYIPKRFSKSVEGSINNTNGKPLFFALHLCLAHYPYNTSDFSRSDAGSRWHKKLLGRLDQQFSEVMHSLEVSGFLEDAIVIIFSDHGESLKVNDRENHILNGVDGADDHKDLWSTPSGHGSSLLRRDQIEVLLSVSVFEDGEVKNTGVDPAIATLSDIYPTVLEYLGKQLPPEYLEICDLCEIGVESTSLNDLHGDSDRWVFMETGLSFSFLSGLVDLSSKELEEALSNIAVEAYEIGEAGKFAVMRSEWVSKFEKSKSFAFLSRRYFIYSGKKTESIYVMNKDKNILSRCDTALECERLGVRVDFFEFLWKIKG